ncbi:hypothetical protein ACFQS1_09550 [Paractinoplanes rhizophilus]|jgi:hypothetical protein|uniref:Uncharacterized protein n=1 Tax=Paractinoplanes rhizophilus TaxID=1416877 RepID=A0ABW2HLX8_9ACTN
MQELGLIALFSDAATKMSHSALPDSPVIPERPPGRLRVRTAGALHRLADRLDGRRLIAAVGPVDRKQQVIEC